MSLLAFAVVLLIQAQFSLRWSRSRLNVSHTAPNSGAGQATLVMQHSMERLASNSLSEMSLSAVYFMSSQSMDLLYSLSALVYPNYPIL